MNKGNVKQCEQTLADQNFNWNDAEQADVDGDEDLNMDMENDENDKQNCHFCQKSFRTKDKVGQHIITH